MSEQLCAIRLVNGATNRASVYETCLLIHSVMNRSLRVFGYESTSKSIRESISKSILRTFSFQIRLIHLHSEMVKASKKIMATISKAIDD